jgi:hypothetical protein
VRVSFSRSPGGSFRAATESVIEVTKNTLRRLGLTRGTPAPVEQPTRAVEEPDTIPGEPRAQSTPIATQRVSTPGLETVIEPVNLPRQSDLAKPRRLFRKEAATVEEGQRFLGQTVPSEPERGHVGRVTRATTRGVTDTPHVPLGTARGVTRPRSRSRSPPAEGDNLRPKSKQSRIPKRP